MRWFAAVLIFLSYCQSWCEQTQVAAQLKSAYQGKTFLLRNFYSGSDLQYDKDGFVLGSPVPVPWTLASVEVTDISAKPQAIEIAADRLGVLYKGEKARYVKIGKLKIHLARAVGGTQADDEVLSVFRKIFVDPREDLRPIVPDYWQFYLSGSDASARRAAWNEVLQKTNGAPVNLHPGDTSRLNGPVTPPKTLYHPDPKYTKEAASLHIEGRSTFSIVIDSAGNTAQVAVMQAVGMGLDDEGVAVLKRWKFQPAMVKGQGVPILINVEINFRCCP
jgi:TonB family protein